MASPTPTYQPWQQTTAKNLTDVLLVAEESGGPTFKDFRLWPVSLLHRGQVRPAAGCLIDGRDLLILSADCYIRPRAGLIVDGLAQSLHELHIAQRTKWGDVFLVMRDERRAVQRLPIAFMRISEKFKAVTLATPEIFQTQTEDQPC